MKSSLKQKLQITGVKPSISNNQLLISTGIPTLDIILGGGLPIGTIMMIEEDESHCYSDHMIKYFIAEGVVSKHQIFIGNLEKEIDDIINGLPSLLNYEKYIEEQKNDELTIAWRYANTPKATPAPHFSHYYDRDITMSRDQLQGINFTKYPEDSSETIDSKDHLDNLLKKIESCLKSQNFKISNNNRPVNVLRIVIGNLGSPLWWEEDAEKFGKNLCHFFIILKSIVRSSYSSVVLSVPCSLYPKYIVSRIENIIDFVVKLESFEETKKSNQIFKDYQGLFTVIKLPHLNSLVSSNESDLSDYAFKLRRKRFTIEKLHLPPLFSDESKDQQPTLTGCSTAVTNNKLDF